MEKKIREKDNSTFKMQKAMNKMLLNNLAEKLEHSEKGLAVKTFHLLKTSNNLNETKALLLTTQESLRLEKEQHSATNLSLKNEEQEHTTTKATLKRE